MEAIISPIVEKTAEYSVAPVVRQFGYLIRYKSNVSHLADQVQQLCNKRDGLNMEVASATNASMRIDPGVKSWQEEVEKIVEKKEACFKGETVATKATCCNGWFPNLKGRYSLGRKAKKMTLDVDNLLARNLGTIAHPAPHPEVGASSSGINIDFESRRSTIRDVMEALKGNQINLIVICGMGGVGKTTLVHEVVKKAKIEGLFDDYAKAVVNEPPHLSKIQRDIAEYLGLPLTEEGLEARADKLHGRLSGKRVLVVLDNVWTTPKLGDIGIPCDAEGCKILVTSRNQHVFNEMKKTRKKFSIEVLPESDAWSLFKEVAGGYIESDPELRSIAEQVLRECDGLPVAISTLGSALRDREKPFWKDALGQLQKPFRGGIEGMKRNVYQPIRLSYDFLEREEAKSCFLLCCVFPESTDIPVEDLVIYGLGLGLFQEIIDPVLEGGRNRVEALLDTLKSCYLLLDSHKKECVRMHDVVRAVGLHIASDESGGTFLVRHRVALEGLAPHYTCASLTVTSNKTSPELLLLSSTDKEKISSLEIPGTLNGVEDLKVLDISVYVRGHPTGLASLPVLLRNIQTLCLKGLELELQTIYVIGKLRTLMILRLSGSTIMHVPEEFKYLCNLKLLDLADCRRLEEISPGVISSLSKLEELYLWDSFDKWDDDGIIGLSSELVDLPLLTRLEIELPPVVDILRINIMLLFDKLKRFKLNIRGRNIEGITREVTQLTTKEQITKALVRIRREMVGLGRGRMEWLQSPDNCLILENLDADSLVAVTVLLKKTHVLKLKMKSSNDVAVLKVDFPVFKGLHVEEMCNFKEIWSNQLSPYSFCELRQLHVENCDEISHLVPTYMQDRLQKLEEINVWDCSSLQEIFQTNQGIMQINNQIMDFKVFQHLTYLCVVSCDSLRKVCSSSTAKSLVNLKKLDIWNCRNMEEIVAAEEGEEAEDNNMFPHLRKLSLWNLPNLASFSRHKYALDWQSAEFIQIWECPKMKKFSSGSLITPMKMKMNIDRHPEVDENIERELEMSKKEKPAMNF